MTTDTMLDVYDRREALDGSEWGRAWNRTTRRIIAHPTFAALVREVAVAEAPTRSPGSAWRTRNSLTYGLWADRGNPPYPRRGPKRGEPGTNARNRRAYYFAEAIADDLGMLDGPAPADSVARVYVCARDWVQARQIPGDPR